MILAVLYGQNSEVIAAGPACDQFALGDRYWREIHPANFKWQAGFDTVYFDVSDQGLRTRLLALGIEDDVCGNQLAQELHHLTMPSTSLNRAA